MRRECISATSGINFEEYLSPDIIISEEVIDKCRAQVNQKNEYCQRIIKAYDMSDVKEVGSTCYSDKQEKWFWAFGKYWFKIF